MNKKHKKSRTQASIWLLAGIISLVSLVGLAAQEGIREISVQKSGTIHIETIQNTSLASVTAQLVDEQEFSSLHAQNRILRQLPPEERLQKGYQLIFEFIKNDNAKDNDLFLRPLFPANKTFELPKTDLRLQMARDGTTNTGSMVTLAKLKNQEELLRGLDPSKPKPLQRITKKGLLVIVDAWLRKDEFTKQSGIQVQDVRPMALTVLNEVTEHYKKVSYGKLHLQFDICEVDGGGLQRPSTMEDLIFSAVALCELEKGFIYFSDYETIIVYPGYPEEEDHLASIWPVSISTFSGDYTFCGTNVPAKGFSTFPLGTLNKFILSHETGHCLGLPHAAAYDCDNEVYGSTCEELEYGDVYDLMGYAGNGDFYFEAGLKELPQTNCFYKGLSKWLWFFKVGEGTNRIATLNYPSSQIPQCLFVDVDQYFIKPNLPCEALFIEYRSPVESQLPGLAVHCATPRASGYTTKLLDCSPDSISTTPVADFWDSLIDDYLPQQVCETGLGWDISFSAFTPTWGEVTLKRTPKPCDDLDGDGFQTSLQPAGCQLATYEDCDDGNKDIHPNAQEGCNNMDDNCNSQIDEGVALPYYLDTDQDGYGSSSVQAVMACQLPSKYVANNLDCDDSDAGTKPGGAGFGIDICDDKDNNCDGVVDGFAFVDETCPVCSETGDVGPDPLLGGIVNVFWKFPPFLVPQSSTAADKCVPLIDEQGQVTKSLLMEFYCAPNPYGGSKSGKVTGECPDDMTCIDPEGENSGAPAACVAVPSP